LSSRRSATGRRFAWRDGLEQLDLGEVLVARVVRATSLPTLWGLGARFPAGGERRWRARLATLPKDPSQAALALLEFHPEDVAGEIEAARLIARADRITLLGTDPRLLRAIASHVQASLGQLIAARDEVLAA